MQETVTSLNTYKSLFPGSPCNRNGIPNDLSPSSTIISAPGGHSVLKEPLKKELDSLVEQGILAKVTEPTLVFVTKSTGALRLCLDLRT